jgi:IS605 OrfB family transposase
MILVERHFFKGNKDIIRLCIYSKELYNRCNYFMRKSWFEHKYPLPDIKLLLTEVKNIECYKKLHNTKTAKQTIRKCLTDWENFLKSLNAYKKDKNTFKSKPKPPKYKNKMAQIIFDKETIKGGRSKKILTQITPTNDCFSVSSDKKFKQVIITPKTFGFIIEIVYDTQDQKEKKYTKEKVDKNKICTIDIGLNNLCAITLDQKRSILINGHIIKSINQWYNKNPCKTRSKKRYFRIQNYFHNVSKIIVENCIKYGIGKIIIGKNDGCKIKMNLGKRNNQNFQFIPIFLLLEKIKYKAEISGIEVIFTEESYTSQSSFYDNDPLPRYGEKEVEFSGKRKYRGLYVTKDGFALNADINGSLNIGRKVIPEFLGIGDRSLAARPVIVNPLRKLNGEGLAVNN